MAKENLSEEEQAKKAEKAQEEKRENALTIINAKSSMWNYALPRLVTPAQFGQVSELAKRKYSELISKAPEQITYEQLFLPALSHDGGAITSPYLQERSAGILQEQFSYITIQDALEYVGSKKSVIVDYANKYVGDLKEEELKAIIGSCMGFTINKKVASLLNDSNKDIASGLEQILTEPDKKEEKKEE